jgi:hypothetical protein
MSLALGVYYFRSPVWFRVLAILANALWALVGLALLLASIAGLLGFSYFAVASPAVAIPFAVLLFIAPGFINVRAMWLRKPAAQVAV